MIVRTAPQELPVGGKFGGQESGQLLLTAKAAERNKFWKGQPLAR